MLRRRKHGTTGRLALPHQRRQKGEIAETVRSAPGRDPRMARFIRILSAIARENGWGTAPQSGPKWGPCPGMGNLRRLDTTRSPGVLRRNFLTFATFRGLDDGGIHLSRAGFPGGRDGQGIGRYLSSGA